MPPTQALINHWSHLHRELSALTKLFELDGAAKANFDEYLDVNEFDLALHTLCDHLLDRTGRSATDLEIKAIETLHQDMGLVDKCVASLKTQAQFRASNPHTLSES